MLSRIKIADFGLAYAVEEGSGEAKAHRWSKVVGTPAYMAPEQWRGAWRDFGPWTDLYALGCIAYEWCCGTLSAEGESSVDIRSKHLGGDRAAFEPRIAVPAEVEGGSRHWWVR